MDLVVGNVKDIVSVGLTIKQAVETVRENKQVCEQIGTRVQRLTDILLWLEETQATKHPAMASPLNDLKEILDRALELVKKCQEKHTISHLFKANSLSQDLKKVNQDIMDQMDIANFANNVNSAQNASQIISSHIQSGVDPTLPKEAWRARTAVTEPCRMLPYRRNTVNEGRPDLAHQMRTTKQGP